MDDLNHIHTDGPFKGWSRKMVLDEIAKEYGAWTYYDEVTVIAGGQKWTVPKGKPLEAKTGSPPNAKKATYHEALEPVSALDLDPDPAERLDLISRETTTQRAIDHLWREANNNTKRRLINSNQLKIKTKTITSHRQSDRDHRPLATSALQRKTIKNLVMACTTDRPQSEPDTTSKHA